MFFWQRCFLFPLFGSFEDPLHRKQRYANVKEALKKSGNLLHQCGSECIRCRRSNSKNKKEKPMRQRRREDRKGHNKNECWHEWVSDWMNEWVTKRTFDTKTGHSSTVLLFTAPASSEWVGGWLCGCVRNECSAFVADTNYPWLFYHLGEIAKISWMVNKRHIPLLVLLLILKVLLLLPLLLLLLFVCFVCLFAWLYIRIGIWLFAQSHANINWYLVHICTYVYVIHTHTYI